MPFGCSTSSGQLEKSPTAMLEVSNYCNTPTLGDDRIHAHKRTHTHRPLSWLCDTGKVKLVHQSAGLLTNLREVLLQSIEAFASRLVLSCDGLESYGKLDLLCFDNALLIAM